MSIKDGILIENKREIQNTRRMIERLNDEHANWKPHDKSMTALNLAKHVVELHVWLSEALAKDSLDFKTDYKPLVANNFGEVLEILNKAEKDNEDFINQQSENFWLQDYVIKSGDHIISKSPRIGALRYFLNNHLIHHRGQLSVYLRLLDIPVPGVYGPSADEKI